jgi:hypothetical protein
MDDLFLPGWQVPPGTRPYSIQDLLQAAFPPAVPSSDTGIQSFSSSAGPPSGGLLGILARENADWNHGLGVSDPSASSVSGGLFSSLSRPDTRWRTLRTGCRRPFPPALARGSRNHGMIRDRMRCGHRRGRHRRRWT